MQHQEQSVEEKMETKGMNCIAVGEQGPDHRHTQSAYTAPTNTDRVAEHHPIQPVSLSVCPSVQFISLGKIIIIPPPTTSSFSSSPKDDDEDDGAARETFNWTKTVDAVRCNAIHRLSTRVLLLLLLCHLHFSQPINILLYNSRFGTVQSVLAEFTAAKFPQFRKILFHLLLIPGRRDYLFKCLNDEYTMWITIAMATHFHPSHAHDHSLVNCIMASNPSLCALHNSNSLTRINKILFTGERRQSSTALH